MGIVGKGGGEGRGCINGIDGISVPLVNVQTLFSVQCTVYTDLLLCLIKKSKARALPV
jgi:hypothetical protein